MTISRLLASRNLSGLHKINRIISLYNEKSNRMCYNLKGTSENLFAEAEAKPHGSIVMLRSDADEN